jgi:hypothetical protein
VVSWLSHFLTFSWISLQVSILFSLSSSSLSSSIVCRHFHQDASSYDNIGGTLLYHFLWRKHIVTYLVTRHGVWTGN